MDSPNPFSKGFKKLKDKLAAGSPKRDGRYGSENDQGGREADVERSEASQRNSDLHSDVEDVGSGTSREEVGLVDPPTSTPPIPRDGEPDSSM